MGDMREVFDAYNEMKAERRAGLEPKRFKYAIEQLEALTKLEANQ